jgi:hypothetical protein
MRESIADLHIRRIGYAKPFWMMPAIAYMSIVWALARTVFMVAIAQLKVDKALAPFQPGLRQNTATHSRNSVSILNKKDRVVTHRLTTQALHFAIAAGTEHIKPNAILFRLN